MRTKQRGNTYDRNFILIISFFPKQVLVFCDALFYFCSFLAVLAERNLQMKKLSNQNLRITLYSTPAERFNPTPKTPMRITWISGLRGKGLCIPKSEKGKRKIIRRIAAS